MVSSTRSRPFCNYNKTFNNFLPQQLCNLNCIIFLVTSVISNMPILSHVLFIQTNKVNQLVLSRKMLVSQLVTSGSDDVVNRVSTHSTAQHPPVAPI